MLFGVGEMRDSCQAGCKAFSRQINPFCGIIVAFQNIRKTNLKPVISHMESAPGLAGSREKLSAGSAPNTRR